MKRQIVSNLRFTYWLHANHEKLFDEVRLKCRKPRRQIVAVVSGVSFENQMVDDVDDFLPIARQADRMIHRFTGVQRSVFGPTR